MRIAERIYGAACKIADLPNRQNREWVLHGMSPHDLGLLDEAARTDWPSLSRRKQRLPAGSWRWCLWVAGRGWGKTRAGAEAVRAVVEAGLDEYISVVGPTVTTLHRDLLGGPSGIANISPKWWQPTYHVTRLELVYPRHPITGIKARVALLSADKPDRIRGSQCSFAWCDEPTMWSKAAEAWAMVDLSLRLGKNPRGVASMTPKATKFTRDLILGRRGTDGKRVPMTDVIVVKGRSWENTAISRAAFDAMRAANPGMLGRQELEAEIIEEPDGALFKQEDLDRYRVASIPPGTRIKRTVVAVDPSRSPIGGRDTCGIVAGAVGADGHVYLYEDASVNGSPYVWANRAAAIALKYRADLVIYEQNRVDEGISMIIRRAATESSTKWEPRTAQGTKQARAEPISYLVQEGRVHLVGRNFDALEAELTTWDPASGDSPDRLDAFVWCCTELGVQEPKRKMVVLE